MAFKDLFKKITGNVLYYPGCLTKGIHKTEFNNYKEIFNKLRIDFILIPDESCCGLPVLNSGHKKDAKKLAEKNLEKFKKRKVYKIITNCPSCYHTFKTIYPSLIKNWDIKVEHASTTIHNAIKKKKISSNKEKEKVSYHDPCHLGRYEKQFEIPRKVITQLGGELIEPINTKKMSFCCGGGGGVRANYPDLAKKTAKLRISHFPEDVKKIITPCGLCYSNLSEQDERVIEFSTYVLGKLRGIGK